MLVSSVPRGEKKIIDAVSMGADITSEAFLIEGYACVGIEIVWTWTSGASAGTWSVEVSNSATKAVTTDGTWIALTFSPTLTAVAGTNSSIFVNITKLGAKWVRVKY